MRRPNHASRFEGMGKTKLQAARAADTETLQSQVNKAAEKRLSLSGLEVLHGRRSRLCACQHGRGSSRSGWPRWWSDGSSVGCASTAANSAEKTELPGR